MHLNKFKAKNIFEMPKNLVQFFIRQSGMLERLRFLMFLSGKKISSFFILTFQDNGHRSVVGGVWSLLRRQRQQRNAWAGGDVEKAFETKNNINHLLPFDLFSDNTHVFSLDKQNISHELLKMDPSVVTVATSR